MFPKSTYDWARLRAELAKNQAERIAPHESEARL
jgi:hypothetical protein